MAGPALAGPALAVSACPGPAAPLQPPSSGAGSAPPGGGRSSAGAHKWLWPGLGGSPRREEPRKRDRECRRALARHGAAGQAALCQGRRSPRLLRPGGCVFQQRCIWTLPIEPGLQSCLRPEEKARRCLIEEENVKIPLPV